ncbi:GNAT family N-acetyltransferase [Streptomyces sp. TLI_171]|uniref:GNAT family N-acetyltransferase n=1 Tax=Streptomyces sp. TLI_171 TaxID=1938859 RepID=UPI000C19CACD|nr:GNAT family N-acetyltransferase [Streptomyces sp. TLI_171]
MPEPTAWPVAAEIVTAALRLEPLRVAHAAEAHALFDDARLHAFTGGTPRSPAELEAAYRRQTAGRSPDGTEGWLNWLIRRTSDGVLVGTVQATLRRTADGRTEAELAWVVGTAQQGRGYAKDGARAVTDWLRGQGVTRLLAHVHPDHHASAAVAAALGLAPTAAVVDGERRWQSD